MGTFVESSGVRSVRARRSRWLLASSGLVAAAALAVGGFVAPTGAAADTAPRDPADPTSPVTASADSLPTPQINGVVWDQAVAGDVVYVAGSFSSARPFGAKPGVTESPRSNLLAYNLKTGELLPYAPSFNAQVRALTLSPDGKRLYAVGHFTTVNGQPRYRIAAFDLPSGDLVAGFAPFVDAALYTAQATNTALYVGGAAKKAAQAAGKAYPASARTNAAAFSTADGAVLPWAPVMTDGWVNSMVISPAGDKIVLGGAFRSLNGSSDPGYTMGALDTVTGTKVLPWKINTSVPQRTHLNVDQAVYGLGSDGTSVYGTAGPVAFEGTFKASWADGSLSWIADCHGDTYSVVPVGDVVYTASHAHDCGNVNSFGDYIEPKKWYRALALTTATTQRTRAEDGVYNNYAGTPAPTVLDWYPAFDTGTTTGQGPWDVAAAQGYVLYGGEFSHVNDKGQQGLARFATTDKAPNKVGPYLSGADMKPTSVVTFDGTGVMIRWSANFDWDNSRLTYQLMREGTTEPVFETTVDSTFFTRPRIHAMDTGLTPGTTYTYRVRTVDPFGNATVGDPVTYTAGQYSALAGVESAYDQMVLEDQPATYWPMNDTNRDNRAFDWAYRSNARLSLLVSFIGMDGKTAVPMDGVTNNVWTESPYTPSSTFSMELWFKTSTRSGGLLMGFSNKQGPGAAKNATPTDAHDRQLYMDDKGRINFEVYDVQNSKLHTVTSPSAYNNGAWHHVVTSVTANGVDLFVDGKRQATGPMTGTLWSYSGYWGLGGHQMHGRVNPPTSNFIAAHIDNVATYDRALPAVDVARHYAVGATTPNVAPVASFTSSSKELVVSVDGSGSSDADGKVASFAWDFGDGSTGSGATASHTYAKAGTYTVALTVTDDRGGKATTSKQVTVSASPTPPAPTGVVAEDAFERSVASGWGSAVTGGAWSAGKGSTVSVGGGVGKLTGVKGQTSTVGLPGAVSDSTDMSASFRFDNAASGGGQHVWFTGRQVGTDSYTARIWVQSNGVLQLQLQQSGKNLSVMNLTGVTYKPGEPVHIRFRVVGSGTTTLQAKVWTTGAEPAEWTKTVTDTTAALQAAGSVGIGLYVSGSATATSTVSIDDYTVKKIVQ